MKKRKFKKGDVVDYTGEDVSEIVDILGKSKNLKVHSVDYDSNFCDMVVFEGKFGSTWGWDVG